MSITAEFARQLSPYINSSRWLVAFSGGVDSSVLLHLAVQLSKQYSGPPVAAIHIHHGLSEHANAWQAHCRAHCEALGVTFLTENVQLDMAGKGIEAAARDVRYQSFKKHLARNEVLLLGHNQNDQAETVLFRLFRSAGVQGLAAIRPNRAIGSGQLLRPLLNISRDNIEHYAKEQAIGFVHDDSNDSVIFDRNFIRHQVLPAINQRWPQSVSAISRSAEYMAEAATLIDELAAQDLAACSDAGKTLALPKVIQLSPSRQNNLLRFWLGQYGLRPSAPQLAQVKQQFLNNNVEASPEIKLDGWQLNRYQASLYCEPEYNLPPVLPKQWQFSQVLNVSEHILLSAEAIPSGGLNLAGLIDLSFERGSIRFHPKGRGHSNSLKKLMREYKILPWHRHAIPQLLINGELVAVPGVGINERFQAKTGEQGYQICLTIGRHSYLCE